MCACSIEKHFLINILWNLHPHLKPYRFIQISKLKSAFNRYGNLTGCWLGAGDRNAEVQYYSWVDSCPEVLFKTCVAMKFVIDDDDDKGPALIAFKQKGMVDFLLGQYSVTSGWVTANWCSVISLCAFKWLLVLFHSVLTKFSKMHLSREVIPSCTFWNIGTC